MKSIFEVFLMKYNLQPVGELKRYKNIIEFVSTDGNMYITEYNKKAKRYELIGSTPL